MEEWKDISGFEGRYKISNEGKVWSLLTNQLLSIQTDKHGYKWIRLRNDKQESYKIFIHQLVLKHFGSPIPLDMKKPTVNHINHIRSDNRIENLEWMEHKENSGEHSHNGGKPKKSIRCVETNEIYESISAAAKDKHIQRTGISRCLKGEFPRCGGYHWEVIEDE